MEESMILQKVRELYYRYRMITGWEKIAGGILAGLILSCIYIAFVKVTGFWAGYYWYFIVLPITAVIVAFVLHQLKKVSFMDVALKSDERLQLKEKLSTALEWIQDQRVRTPMFRGLIRDTAQATKDVKGSKVFPIEWKTPLKKISAVSLFLVFFLWMPTFSLFSHREDPKIVRSIQQEAKKIEESAKKLEKKQPKNPANLKKFKKAEKELKKLASELKSPDIKKREALAKISRVQDSINQDTKQKADMEKMEQDLRKALFSGENKDDKGNEDTFGQLSKKIQNLAQKLKDENLSKEEKEQIQKELEKIKSALDQSGQKNESLEKALQNMKKGNNQAARQNLSEAGEQFQQRQREMEDMEDLEELGDQLEESQDMISGRRMSSNYPNMEFKEGDGNQEADFGKGSTNKEQKTEKPAGNVYTKRQHESTPDRQGTYEKLYGSTRNEYEKATGQVKGKISKGPTIRSLRTSKRGAPRTGDKAKESPGEVYARYKAINEEALKKEKIPSRYKKLIRNYYDEIDPHQGKEAEKGTGKETEKGTEEE